MSPDCSRSGRRGGEFSSSDSSRKLNREVPWPRSPGAPEPSSGSTQSSLTPSPLLRLGLVNENFRRDLKTLSCVVVAGQETQNMLHAFFFFNYYLRELEAEHPPSQQSPRKPGTSHGQSCPSGSHHSPPASEMLLCLTKQKLQDTAHEWCGNHARTEGIQRAYCCHVPL